MFNKKDSKRNAFMLNGQFARRGYDWWWHSFTGTDDETGEEVPFFIEFFTCNPALAESRPVLGQATENKQTGKKPSYLMVKAGCWGNCKSGGHIQKMQLHRFFPWTEVEISKGAPYSVEAADCFASDTSIRGSIIVSESESREHPELMSDYGSIEWDLQLEKITAFNVGYGASGLFRALKAFEMYWHAEGMKTLVSGKIKMNGKSYTIRKESSYGYADKNWGCGFTSPWVWLSSNDLTSRITGKRLTDSVFDIGGGRPKVFGIALERKLLSAFWYEGKPYEFNFSKFWTGTKTSFSYEETDDEIIWHVKQSTHRAIMQTEMHCKKADMLFVNYEDPDGNKRFQKLWNGGNGWGNVKLYKRSGLCGKVHTLIDDIDVKHLGCEYGEFEK